MLHHMSDGAPELEAVNQAVQDYVAAEGEIVTQWALVAEVARPDGGRHLCHRGGGGHDGSAIPTMWAVLGMLEASAHTVRDQLTDVTGDA
jgi:hypothetical protein